MAVEKTIMIDGRPVKFRASAATPRLYREKFGRDIFQDLARLEKSVSEELKSGNGQSNLTIETLMMFEDVAYTMAKHADPGQPDTTTEWLEQFGALSIYWILPQILRLWGRNNQTTAEAKKKAGPAPEK